MLLFVLYRATITVHKYLIAYSENVFRFYSHFRYCSSTININIQQTGVNINWSKWNSSKIKELFLKKVANPHPLRMGYHSLQKKIQPYLRHRPCIIVNLDRTGTFWREEQRQTYRKGRKNFQQISKNRVEPDKSGWIPRPYIKKPAIYGI